MSERTCTIDGCNSSAVARGWCDKHYRRWRRHGDPTIAGRIVGDDRKRFFSHVAKGGPDDCWLWEGSHNAPRYGTPYGTFRYQGRTRPAHLVAYLLTHGPDSVPAGRVLDHLCRVTLCVNPAHLEPITQRENIHRGRLLKVTDAQIAELAARLAAGESLTVLAREVGVTPQAIRLRLNKQKEAA